MTVVVPSYNQVNYLRLTLSSIYACIERLKSSARPEDAANLAVEVWVQDGGSTDGSRELLEAERAAGRLDFVSERDNGQAAAINTAIRRQARGHWIGWINSDDLWHQDALARLYRASREDRQAQWFYGDVDIIDGRGRPMRAWVTAYKRFIQGRVSLKSLLLENPICQMGTFFTRDAFLAVGGLRPELRYAMDYEFWLKLYGRFGAPAPIPRGPVPVGSFRMVRGTKSMDGFTKQFAEELAVALEYRELAAGGATDWPRFTGERLPSRARMGFARKKIVGVYRVLRAVGG